MAGVSGPDCTTMLVAHHLLSAAPAFVAYRCGERLLDGLAEWHGWWSDWLEGKLEAQAVERRRAAQAQALQVA
jgi:hypothetical protein